MLKVAPLIAILVMFLVSCTPAVQPATIPTFTDIPPTETASPVPTNTPTIAPTETSTPIPATAKEAVESTTTATTEPAFVRPTSHRIESISGVRQTYPLSCESRLAVDWAAYYGVEIYEFEFQHGLPISDNPDLGFVGSVTGPWGQVPPYAYGVHAAPVAELLREEYGLPAVAEKNMSMDQLKDIIAQDHPVIAWVIGNVVGGVPYVYTDSQGNEVTVAAYEHVVIVIGYNDETEKIIYMNNGRFYTTPEWVFENSWSVLEYMGVYWGDNMED